MVMGSMTVQTDVVVVGAGPGGYVAAIRAAQLGFDVLLIERDPFLGGCCLNTGCIPTKALITASNFYNAIADMNKMGIMIQSYTVDTKAMMGWSNAIIQKMRDGIKGLCDKNGVEIINGTGVFKDATTLHIEGKSDVTQIQFKYAIIATGSTPLQIPGFPFDGKYVISSTEALQIQQLPQSLTIIGGGYIGTEVATIYGKLGCKVHIVEGADRLIPSLDAEVVSIIDKKIRDFNVSVHVNTKAKQMRIKNDLVELDIDENGTQGTITAGKLLVAVGRKPNSANMGLQEAGVHVDEKGFITVNSQMQTSVPNIYAIGDVVGQPMLAHKAMREAKVAAECIANLPSAFDNKVIPFVVFNDPEICSVGLTADDAQKKGYSVITKRFPFTALPKAHMVGKTDGFVKIVSDAATKVVLGVHAVGPSVSEIAGEAALAIEMGATVDDLSLTIHPHPTVSESLVEAADVVLGSAVHLFVPKEK